MTRRTRRRRRMTHGVGESAKIESRQRGACLAGSAAALSRDPKAKGRERSAGSLRRKKSRWAQRGAEAFSAVFVSDMSVRGSVRGSMSLCEPAAQGSRQVSGARKPAAQRSWRAYKRASRARLHCSSHAEAARSLVEPVVHVGRQSSARGVWGGHESRDTGEAGRPQVRSAAVAGRRLFSLGGGGEWTIRGWKSACFVGPTRFERRRKKAFFICFSFVTRM